ncbi:MAG: PilZ domain-containing protein [Nitrospiraceae bacterium]|nr:MAG: PilZ domain-containing protein [Nitrospiraceae bacterium]
MLHERRNCKRLDIFHVIEITSASPLLGLIRNFSCRGFTFELDSVDFDQKKNIEFKLKYPQRNLMVYFMGDMIWEKRVANTFTAGIRFGKMDKEMKDRLMEILCSIKNIAIDVFEYQTYSEKPGTQREDEETAANVNIKLMSEISQKSRRKLVTSVTIGLAISLISLVGVFTFKGLREPFSNAYYHITQNVFEKKKHLSKSENMLRHPVKEQVSDRILNEDLLFKKVRETSSKDHRRMLQARADYRIERKNELKGSLKDDDLPASRLVYTIQIESLLNIEDAQNKFDDIIRSLSEKHLNTLRIEKVGKYYTLRLGKFENYETAGEILKDINPYFSEAIILKAYIKNERIINIMNN